METEGNLAESTFSHAPVRIISSPLKLITLAHFLLLLHVLLLLQRMARIKSMENSKLNNDFSRELTKQMNKVSG